MDLHPLRNSLLPTKVCSHNTNKSRLILTLSWPPREKTRSNSQSSLLKRNNSRSKPKSLERNSMSQSRRNLRKSWQILTKKFKRMRQLIRRTTRIGLMLNQDILNLRNSRVKWRINLQLKSRTSLI